MRSLIKLTLVEVKLFFRDPLSLIFTLAFPLFVLFVLAEVFGDEPEVGEDDVWRGVGPTQYYVPAYVGLVIAAVALMRIPVHLSGYRERGILRRFRASSLPPQSLFGSQLVVSLAVAVAGSLLLTAAALAAYGIDLPDSWVGVIGAFVLSALAFLAFGVLLGSLLPSVRSAQAAGLILFFVMLFISGAGPPRDTFSDELRAFGLALPLTHVILMLQDPWLGFGWDLRSSAVVSGIGVVSAVITLRFFRWE